jgi:predicted ABC-type ATPase
LTDHADAAPLIVVLAGTNGAGKSSIGGAALKRRGGELFNPDEAARRILERNPGLSQRDANIAAWSQGKRLLEQAIMTRKNYYFETTLGGKTITALLEKALDAGFEVRIWYAGLDGVDLHIARVAARVARGGHPIPERDIRRRYDSSRRNLIRLLPRLAELRVFDNSREADPHTGATPRPQLVLHCERGRILGPNDLSATPSWARPIVAAAMKHPQQP